MDRWKFIRETFATANLKTEQIQSLNSVVFLN